MKVEMLNTSKSALEAYQDKKNVELEHLEKEIKNIKEEMRNVLKENERLKMNEEYASNYASDMANKN
eukprot:CAMPEP_0114589254 /NCGR_PEP_ID=MMETSP0125-20121206/11749_1 /TAXON_ID=485358 ORGANISM="Aristerostoma sp., Strain ATCC 50986" /NCGR_SAMPLE_ID=MMETSP0125 /ASSEMBLY_ACC=CAM_ASM_000245 /LENGTH=66 /DNA_ID=CAMNT_0001786051 /DNA_START=1101 /DNA_END=1301 /DNA_ORIENTATION=-